MSLTAYHVRYCAHDTQVGGRHTPPVESRRPAGETQLLFACHANRAKSIVKSPKLYFADAVYFARCSIFAPKKPYASRPPLAQYGRPFVFAQLRDRECRVGREG